MMDKIVFLVPYQNTGITMTKNVSHAQMENTMELKKNHVSIVKMDLNLT